MSDMDVLAVMKDDLANAFSKLELATGSHTKALALERDAMNVAAQTGKPLARRSRSRSARPTTGSLRGSGARPRGPRRSRRRGKLKQPRSSRAARSSPPRPEGLHRRDERQAKARPRRPHDGDPRRAAQEVRRRRRGAQRDDGRQAEDLRREFENTKVKVGEVILPLLTSGMGCSSRGWTSSAEQDREKLFDDVANEKLAAWVSENWPQIRPDRRAGDDRGQGGVGQRPAPGARPDRVGDRVARRPGASSTGTRSTRSSRAR
jgi:hypothetical protein